MKPCPSYGAPVRRVQREVMLAMRAYELMVIFDGDIDEAAVNEHLANVNRLIEADGGTVATTDQWGRRRFAYEINHKNEGIYVVLEIVDRGVATSTTSTASCASRTRSSATRSSACPTREAADRGLARRRRPRPPAE